MLISSILLKTLQRDEHSVKAEIVDFPIFLCNLAHYCTFPAKYKCFL